MLCREPRLYSCQRLKQACEQQGIQLDILDPNRMLLQLAVRQGCPSFQLFYQAGEIYDQNAKTYLLPEYSAVLPRFGAASTEMGCNVLRHFESLHVKVLNSGSAFRLARDKWQSLQTLAANHIPVPMSCYAGELVKSASALALHNDAVVIKTLSGAQGVGVILSENHTTGLSIVDTLKQTKMAVLLQQYMPEAKGQDIRAFVIGDQVVAAMLRRSQTGDFRANLHQGGTAESIDLTEEERLIAIKATQAIGLDIAGVDLIRTSQGVMVLEVNAAPGLEGIEQASKIDIAAQMVEYLKNKL